MRFIKSSLRHTLMHMSHRFTRRSSCGIQNQCSWLESLSTASDVTSASSVSCSSPAPFLFPTLFHQLNPSFDTSEGVPHMHVTSPPPPPGLSSWLSIESTHPRLKVVYFVELTLWCLHHLEVGKWYWVERLIFMVESEKSSETFFFALVLRGGQANILLWMAGEEEEGWRLHLWTCVSLRLWMVDCAEGARLETHVYPCCLSHYLWVQLLYIFIHQYPFMYDAPTFHCPSKDCC